MKTQNKIIFSSLISIILFLGFSFSTADAANKYWYKTGADANWDTVTGNWWDTDTEGVYSDQSASVPTTGDFVYIRGPIPPDTAPSTPVALSGFDTQGFIDLVDIQNLGQAVTAPISIQENGTLMIFANVDGGVTFVEWGGTTAATGTFSFSGSDAYNYGTVGNYTTLGENINNYGTVGDYSTCNGCFNEFGGVFGDNVTFNGANNNEGGVIGDYLIANGLYNRGTIGHHATLNPGNGNDVGGTIGDYAIVNEGVWSPDAIFGDYATFNGYYGNYIRSAGNYAIFNGNNRATSGGTIGHHATFNDDSRVQYNSFVGSDATFNDSSAVIADVNNYGTGMVTVGDNATFNDQSYNEGDLLGGATFNDDSYNWGFFYDGVFVAPATIAGNATFNDNSTNSGVITGDATFYGASENTRLFEGNYYPGTVLGAEIYPSASSVVTSPENLSVISSWLPDITFINATVCQYKIDGGDYVTLDCESPSIPTPTEWPHLLTLKADDTITSTISFIFSSLLDVFTGSLTPYVEPNTTAPAATYHTLNDIYNVIVEGAPSVSGDHTLSTSTTPTATTTHSTSEIYARLANLIDATKIKAGVTYLGVTGGGETPEPIEIIPTSLTPLLTPNDRTGFSLEDIYQLVKNNVRVTSSTHDITNSSTVALTQHSIEDIYRTLTALVQPGNIATGTNYLGVEGAYNPLQENLVAHYKLNDNSGSTVIVDSSASGQNGSLTVNTDTRSSAGKVGTAISFQTTEKLQCGEAVVSTLSTDIWSISFWAKRAVSNVHSEYLNLGAAGYAYYNKDTNKMNWHIGSTELQLSTTFTAGTYYLWTFVRDGSTFTLYKNGVLVGTGSNAAVYAPAAIYLGGYGTNYNNTRTLDDARVYNKALSQAEVTAIYNLGNGTEN